MYSIIKSLKKVVLSVVLISTYTFSFSITEKYPSYTYVFAEFDVDESYVFDADFELFVQNNEKRIKAFYKNSLKRGESLLPMIKGSLMDDGLSDLFIYLSMVESGFSSSAVSPKKATGLWQFMPATAKEYNLSVDYSFDERCDPVSSTHAAINYLHKLHRKFGKWYLAAMAYNCGEGRLSKAIKKSGSSELSVLVDDKNKYLPQETREYIKKILLVAMIGESIALDFGNGNCLPTKAFLQVEVLGGTKLKELAQLIEMKPLKLLGLNKQFKNGIIPNEKYIYKVLIPEEKMILFYLRYEFPEEKKSIKPYLLSHSISLGETLKSIAKLYDTKIEEIKIANQLQDDFLTVDTLLLIPVRQDLFDKALTD